MITAENIVKSYHGEQVLKGVSLTVEDGEFVSIMGESGSGKSTLLSILGGFLTPDGGRVLWDGTPLSSLTEARLFALRSTRLGFVFQFFRLVPTLRVRDNMLLPATLGGRVGADTEDYLSELVDRLQLGHLLGKYPTELSGGQCQRVAIVRALVYRPETVILDEPTGALDSGMEGRVMALLRHVNEKEGTTVIQVTHSQAVAAYGRRLIRLSDGEICG
ncbi:MAG: ABC transporter ATP-binding protein [Clostridia bacterium]|nr:ABC transporter ATP-binding protein [Clostridia bacterium]